MSRPSRQPPARDIAPVVQRLRVHHTKTGRLRFASHRDFQRSLERAVRRAGLPIGFSAGFSPHPKISYTNAAPTGAASLAEYLELGLTRAMAPDLVRDGLDAALPAGFDVAEVVPAVTADFAARLQASRWRVELPGLSAAQVGAALAVLVGDDPVMVTRMTKNGPRSMDVRSAVATAAVHDAEHPRGAIGANSGAAAPCAILQLVVRHTTPSVRPDDVLAGLRDAADLPIPVAAPLLRVAQGPLAEDGVTVGDPLAPDREAVVGS